MIIALTGSSGSIGKELVPFFKGLGHDVIKISSSSQPNGVDKFSYFELQNNLISIEVDLFIHLASLNADLNEKDIEQEVGLTEQVLSALPALKCRRLIFFSTSKVYGDNDLDANIFNEKSFLNPQCSYGKAKKLCEELIISKLKSFEINAIILRLPPVLNHSGRGNLSKLINIARKKKFMFSFAQGEKNKRSFISSNNIETVFRYILDNLSIFEKNETYNLSDDGDISLNELLRIGGSKRIYSLPIYFGKILLFFPLFKNIFIKLFGNFVLENSKIKKDMLIKLKTTAESLPIIYK